MKQCGVILSVLLVLGTALFLTRHFWPRPASHNHGPLIHDAYVWQRAWIAPVREAVLQRSQSFRQLVLLGAEVTWQDGKPEAVRVSLDYETVRNARRPVGLALRIGPYPGPFEPNDSVAQFLGSLATTLVQRARTNGVAVTELQLDFDCATSKLDGYRVWVESIARRVRPLPVTVTALPSWLRSPAFKRLAQAAPNYVLQVHSVERPAGFDAPFTLCDPGEACRAVERAGWIGVPFRVALPTYGYVLAFDAQGQYLGLSAEGPRRDWPPGARLREVGANPLELADLLRGWAANRPAAMRGVIWYRLPVAVDNLNWRWPTLDAMLAARVPRERFRADARRVEPGLAELSLVNEGELDISSRLAVEARWSGARVVSGDGQRGFQLVDGGSCTAHFQTQTQPVRLRAGETLVVGWLRFDRDCEVVCEARKLSIGGR